MSDIPHISVCVPAYNRAALLPPLLDSIVSQDGENFEIVICEDASPERDEIRRVAEKYAVSYPGRISYHQNAVNLGYDGNLRRLIESARGEYVLFMGNDDLLAEGALAAVAAAVRAHPNVGVVLRSYDSFVDDPRQPVQTFRYFDSEGFFPAGAQTIATFFRRCVFISGMVVRRESAHKHATDRFDGTLLYQQHLVGQILASENGVYLPQILSHHRLGGTPDFGNSAAEQGRFVPREQTPESSVNFMRGMLQIAADLEQTLGLPVYAPILSDIGNYSYPILSIQADRSTTEFLRYLGQIARLGFWKVSMFYLYAFGLLVLRRTTCDQLIARLKQTKGRAPMLGKVYAGRPTKQASKKKEVITADAKLIVRLKGGLGNQLFCYATGKRLALKNGAELVLDNVTGFKYDFQYERQYALDVFSIPARLASNRERLEPFGRIRRLLMRKVSESLPLNKRRYIRQVGVGFDEALLSLKLPAGTTYFDGFGQSERYFADVEEVIKQDLKMCPPSDPANQKMSYKIRTSRAVAVHVRWFDSNDPSSVSNMSLNYYHAAIDIIREKVHAPHFFIFSDDPKRSAQLLAPLLAESRHDFVDHNHASQGATSDLWLMSQCQHFVIGNSTFAWWAAWLGEKRGCSQVIAPAVNIDPGHNSTAWGFPYLLPDRWLAI